MIGEARVTSDLEALAGDGERFACVYADPPWRFDKTVGRGAAENHYPTMSATAIKAMPVRKIVADDAALFLWVVDAYLFEAMSIIRAWGFEFADSFAWLKPQIGLGNYWRKAHEVMFLGVRGSPAIKRGAYDSALTHPRRRHSEKPGAVRQMIERMTPGPRIELFGRKPVQGWTVYGNQIEADLFVPAGTGTDPVPAPRGRRRQ